MIILGQKAIISVLGPLYDWIPNFISRAGGTHFEHGSSCSVLIIINFIIFVPKFG